MSAPQTYRGVPVPAYLRPHWDLDRHEARFWRVGVDAAFAAVMPILRGLADDEPCTLDHHGYCQMHGLPQPGPCPDGEAQKFIAEGGDAT